jgi:hypothetical protein
MQSICSRDTSGDRGLTTFGGSPSHKRLCTRVIAGFTIVALVPQGAPQAAVVWMTDLVCWARQARTPQRSARYVRRGGGLRLVRSVLRASPALRCALRGLSVASPGPCASMGPGAQTPLLRRRSAVALAASSSLSRSLRAARTARLRKAGDPFALRRTPCPAFCK